MDALHKFYCMIIIMFLSIIVLILIINQVTSDWSIIVLILIINQMTSDWSCLA